MTNKLKKSLISVAALIALTTSGAFITTTISAATTVPNVISSAKAPVQIQAIAKAAAIKVISAAKLLSATKAAYSETPLAYTTLYHFTYTNPAWKGRSVTVTVNSKGSITSAAKLIEPHQPALPVNMKADATKAANQYLSKKYKVANAVYVSFKEDHMAYTTLYHITFTSKSLPKGSTLVVTINSSGTVSSTKVAEPA